jgi:hypothetical protein
VEFEPRIASDRTPRHRAIFPVGGPWEGQNLHHFMVFDVPAARNAFGATANAQEPSQMMIGSKRQEIR